jgi:hypothetical protein
MEHLLNVSALQDAYTTSRFDLYMRRNLAFEMEFLNHLILALTNAKDTLQKEFVRLCSNEYQKKNLFVPFWTFQSAWKHGRALPAPHSWFVKFNDDMMSMEEIVRVTNVIPRLRLLLGDSFGVRVRSFTTRTTETHDVVQTYIDILYFPDKAVTKRASPFPTPTIRSRVVRS